MVQEVKKNLTADYFFFFTYMSLVQIQKVAAMSWLRLSEVLHLGLPVACKDATYFENYSTC